MSDPNAWRADAFEDRHAGEDLGDPIAFWLVFIISAAVLMLALLLAPITIAAGAIASWALPNERRAGWKLVSPTL